MRGGAGYYVSLLRVGGKYEGEVEAARFLDTGGKFLDLSLMK